VKVSKGGAISGPRPIGNPADQPEFGQHVSVRVNKPDARIRGNGEPN
jgi:hypothetical protein